MTDVHKLDDLDDDHFDDDEDNLHPQPPSIPPLYLSLR